MKKLSANTQAFFDYTYKGDGKYYTTAHSGRNYTNTLFQNFRNKNTDCIEVLEYGNDAPRGGKTGDFVVVKFTEQFFKKYQWVLDAIAEKKEVERQKEVERLASEERAKVIFAEYLTEDKKEQLKSAIIDKNSKARTNFLKAKSIQKTGDYRNHRLLSKMLFA